MAEFPSMPLWTDAYLGDTTHLTTVEHGAYLLLLMTAWRARENKLPDDDRLLARYSKLGPAQWKRIKPIIAEFFTIENGHWTQRRLIDEAIAVKQFRERQRKAGKASALKRKGRHSTAVDSGSNLNQPPTPTPTPNLSVEAKASPVAGATKSDENSVDDGEQRQGTSAPPTAADIKKAIFDTGKSILADAGHSDPGGMIVKWRRTYSDSIMLTALTRCLAEQPEQPISWLSAALKAEARKSSGQGSGYGNGNQANLQSNDGAIRELARRKQAREAEELARSTGRRNAGEGREAGQLTIEGSARDIGRGD